MAANNVRNDNEILASSIQAKLHQQSPSRADHCIFRIPHVLVKGKKEVYVPHLLSIGPFQRGLQFQAMEVIKSWYLHCLLERKPTPTTVLEDFVGAIRDMEQDCRDCYEENIALTSDEFVEMMVVDGCFIIELFRKFSPPVPIEDDDPVFHRPWMHPILINDLLLLENQLPWKVIDCLFNLTRESNAPENYSLSELALKYFKGYTLGMRQQVGEELKGKHLLDLVKISLLPSQLKLDQTSSLRMPSVTELVKAGVLFICGTGPDMFNITFKNGVMRIPPIRVHKNGESLFRNLVAYEQCETALNLGIPRISIITSYAALLEQLITSDEDVEYLAGHGIIENVLGHISLIFSSLSNDVRPPNCCYRRLYCDVNKYYQLKWNHYKGALHTYFENPLELMNFATAVVCVSLLTLVQTVYSILSYMKQYQ